GRPRCGGGHLDADRRSENCPIGRRRQPARRAKPREPGLVRGGSARRRLIRSVLASRAGGTGFFPSPAAQLEPHVAPGGTHVRPNPHNQTYGVPVMRQLIAPLKAAALIGIAAAATIARAAGDEPDRNAYVVTPLVSNLSGAAAHRDPVLQNAWGIAFSPAGSPFWVNDNATGCSTLH